MEKTTGEPSSTPHRNQSAALGGSIVSRIKCEKALGPFVWGLAGVHFAGPSAIPTEESAFRKAGP